MLPAIEAIAMRDRGILEVVFKPNGDQHKHTFMAIGLNTHQQHLQITPDVPAATNVTLYGIPHQLPDNYVDDVMKEYGVKTHSYRHKKKDDGFVSFSGWRVYGLHINVNVLPRFIEIQGHRVRTKYYYMDQKIEEEIRRRKDQKKEERKETMEEVRKVLAAANTVKKPSRDNSEEYVTITSCFHPERSTALGIETELQEKAAMTFENIMSAEE